MKKPGSRPSAFANCEGQVRESFSVFTAEKRVFRQKELARFLRDHRVSWGIPEGTRLTELLEFLTAESLLETFELRSENDYLPMHRFAALGASPYAVALSLRETAYLCHATAVFLHGLTDEIPQTIYVNAEQSAKPKPSGELTQAAIDRAFHSHQRSSRYVFVHGRTRLVLLNGKQTGGYGVTTLALTPNEKLRVTNLERTLIDITVRPAYGGGVHQVLAAFRAARKRVSIPKLAATLRQLDYVYPYHQALGFYLERAGVPGTRLGPLREFGLALDFYAAHGLKSPAYDASWRIYYPKGL